MNDNKETRSWNDLAAENKELREYLAKAVLIIDNYERAQAVAEAMAANNDKLGSVDSRTRAYQVQGEVVEVDENFGRHMFECGQLHATWKKGYADIAIEEGIITWKERQAK